MEIRLVVFVEEQPGLWRSVDLPLVNAEPEKKEA